jgi:hypothetical protein
MKRRKRSSWRLVTPHRLTNTADTDIRSCTRHTNLFQQESVTRLAGPATCSDGVAHPAWPQKGLTRAREFWLGIRPMGHSESSGSPRRSHLPSSTQNEPRHLGESFPGGLHRRQDEDGPCAWLLEEHTVALEAVSPHSLDTTRTCFLLCPMSEKVTHEPDIPDPPAHATRPLSGCVSVRLARNRTVIGHACSVVAGRGAGREHET